MRQCTAELSPFKYFQDGLRQSCWMLQEVIFTIPHPLDTYLCIKFGADITIHGRDIPWKWNQDGGCWGSFVLLVPFLIRGLEMHNASTHQIPSKSGRVIAVSALSRWQPYAMWNLTGNRSWLFSNLQNSVFYRCTKYGADILISLYSLKTKFSVAAADGSFPLHLPCSTLLVICCQPTALFTS